MDGYFKLLRAEEEIARLNIEIRRFLTFIHDEDAELSSKEKEIGLTDPAVAYQIRMHRNHFSRFMARHLKNMQDIGQLPGFSGDLSCGVHIAEPSHPAPLPLNTAEPPHPAPLPLDTSIKAMVEDDQIDMEADLEEEQAGEDEEEAVMRAYCSILEFTCDGDTAE